MEEKDADNIRKVLLFVNHSFSDFENEICVVISTESTVLVRSSYSFVAVEVKVWKYNKTLNVRSLGKPVSFVFPRVLMFPETNIRPLGKTKLTVSLGI